MSSMILPRGTTKGNCDGGIDFEIGIGERKSHDNDNDEDKNSLKECTGEFYSVDER